MKKTLLTLCATLALSCGGDVKTIGELRSPEMEIRGEVGMTDYFQRPVVQGELLSEQFVDSNYDGTPELYSKIYDTNKNGINDFATYHFVRPNPDTGEWEYQTDPYAYIFDKNEDQHADAEFFDMDVNGVIEEVLIHALNPKVNK